MTIAGRDLDPDSARDLARLTAVAADAQARALPSQRIPHQQVAIDVIAAFERTHVVRGERWRRRSHATLGGGAVVIIPCTTEDS